jgi:hypothetical protein
LGQFAQHAGLVGRRERYPDAVRGQQFGEQQSSFGTMMQVT